VVLEGGAVGYGASARNGGFAMTLVHRSLQALVDALGHERAAATHRSAEQAIKTIERVTEDI
jgi:hypothetical protein